MQRVRSVVVLSAALFALSACLDLETRITIRDDGSGSIRMLYSADAELVGYGMFEEGETLLPVPFAERDFERLARETEGLQLRSYRRRDLDERIEINAELEFSDLEALNAVYAGRRDYVTMVERNGRMQYRQVILADSPGEIEDETRAFAEEFLAEYELVFEVQAPARILEYNFGELSADGRRIRYASSLVEYVTAEETMTWRLEWER